MKWVQGDALVELAAIVLGKVVDAHPGPSGLAHQAIRTDRRYPESAGRCVSVWESWSASSTMSPRHPASRVSLERCISSAVRSANA